MQLIREYGTLTLLTVRRGKRPAQPTLSGLGVGSSVIVRGVPCVVTQVRPAGTVDVEAVDGSRAWRVSGLGKL